ncbi:MAG: response regulator [Ignavibacteria bacterium]|nr:response regulator [Ignavibacteria bacterium]
MKILLVEDQFINQKLMKNVLEKGGYEVIPASDGESALKLLSENKYDIILMDIQMPELNGYEVAKKFREMEKVSGEYTPILAMTANSLAGDREKSLDSGMDDYIAKPLNMVEINSRIEALLKKNK